MAFSFKREPEFKPVNLVRALSFDEAARRRELIDQYTDLVRLSFNGIAPRTGLTESTPELDALLLTVLNRRDVDLKPPPVFLSDHDDTYYQLSDLFEITNYLLELSTTLGEEL